MLDESLAWCPRLGERQYMDTHHGPGKRDHSRFYHPRVAASCSHRTSATPPSGTDAIVFIVHAYVRGHSVCQRAVVNMAVANMTEISLQCRTPLHEPRSLPPRNTRRL